jgi:hypothetical protein
MHALLRARRKGITLANPVFQTQTVRAARGSFVTSEVRSSNSSSSKTLSNLSNEPHSVLEDDDSEDE